MPHDLLTTAVVALLVGLAPAPTLAQIPADRRADRLFGDDTDCSIVHNVDEIDRIVTAGRWRVS